MGSIPVKTGALLLGEIRGTDKRPPGFAATRLASIERLIEGRFGGPCDTDDGTHLFKFALPMLVEIAKPLEHPINSQAWAWRWVPAFARTLRPQHFAHREQKARTRAYQYTGATIGQELRVRWQEVLDYRLRTITAIDRPPPEELKARKRLIDRENKRKKRLQQGMRPQHQSNEAQEPWVKAGMGRTRWYAERKAQREAQPNG